MARRRWTLADSLLVVGVLAISFFLLAQDVSRSGGNHNGTLSVRVNGEEVMKLELSENREISIRGWQGESFLEIREGRVRMVESACPDKLCVRTGWISRPGESIVCLPNRVVLEIKAPGGGPDVINR
ncbi:MAG: NusG domain II-containing protein [Candidatus Geothermincolales bacterium]